MKSPAVYNILNILMYILFILLYTTLINKNMTKIVYYYSIEVLSYYIISRRLKRYKYIDQFHQYYNIFFLTFFLIYIQTYLIDITKRINLLRFN